MTKMRVGVPQLYMRPFVGYSEFKEITPTTGGVLLKYPKIEVSVSPDNCCDFQIAVPGQPEILAKVILTDASPLHEWMQQGIANYQLVMISPADSQGEQDARLFNHVEFIPKYYQYLMCKTEVCTVELHLRSVGEVKYFTKPDEAVAYASN